MGNKYLYLSSLGAPSHSQFECRLPNSITINPYSQLRVLSCRINLDDNLLEVSSENDTILIGVDHWLKRNCCIPLLPVQLSEGMYDIDNGNVNSLNLVAEMQTRIEEQLQPYCMVRGGSFVSANDGKLTFSVSAMQMYDCPKIALTADVLQYWLNKNGNSTNVSINGDVYDAIDTLKAVQLTTKTDYYGASVDKTSSNFGYYVSPPVVTGLSGGTVGSEATSHYIEVDMKTITQNLGVNNLGTDEFVRFYFGDMAQSDLGLGSYWGSDEKFAKNLTGKLSPKYLYCVELTNNNLTVKYNSPDGDHGDTTVYTVSSAGGNYQINRPFLIEFHEWETAKDSMCRLTVLQQKNDGDPYETMTARLDGDAKKQTKQTDFTFSKLYKRQKGWNTPNRIGMLFETEKVIEGGIKYTARVDDVADKHGYNGTTNQFGGRVSLSADVPDRYLTVFTDSNNKRLSTRERTEFKDRLTTKSFFDATTEKLIKTYNFPLQPNMEVLNMSNLFGFVTTDKSFEGATAADKVELGKIDFPMFYLSIPSLPIQNYSAGFSRGLVNSIVCGIELAESDTSKTYTSKMFTEQYNELTNASPLNIDSLRIKITDIEGKVTRSLQSFTNIVLEIRDNPSHNFEQNHNGGLIDTNNKTLQLIGNQ